MTNQHTPTNEDELGIPRIVKRSQRAVTGDVFGFILNGFGYYHGRVVELNTWGGGFKNGVLIYVYQHCGRHLGDEGSMTTSDFLVPPLMMDMYAWTSGYFVVTRNEPIPSHRLRTHCFLRQAPGSPFVDEFGAPLYERTEPCGFGGLASVGWLALLMKDVLAGNPPKWMSRSVS